MPAWVICSEAAAVTPGNYRQASVQPLSVKSRLNSPDSAYYFAVRHGHYVHFLGP